MIEVNVKVTNSESKLAKRSLLYDEDIVLSRNEPRLERLIEQALKEFERSGAPAEVLLTLKMVW